MTPDSERTVVADDVDASPQQQQLAALPNPHGHDNENCSASRALNAGHAAEDPEDAEPDAICSAPSPTPLHASSSGSVQSPSPRGQSIDEMEMPETYVHPELLDGEERAGARSPALARESEKQGFDGDLEVGRDEDDDDRREKEAPYGSDEPPAPSTLAASVVDVEAQGPKGDVYDRFSPHKKHIIVALVSYSAFIGPIASSAFLPSITVMAEELHTTPAMINYTVAIFIVAIGIAPLCWSPLSGFYGRRPVYLMSMPIMVAASVGVAESRSIGAIIGTRILQGIGSSCVLAVGAGTVGDIYRPTERANAMAWFYSGVLLGPALAPVLAGIFTEYTAITWRATQYFLCAASALSVLLTALFLPETSHPPLPHDILKEAKGKKFVMYWFNPVGSLGLMRYPNITATTVASSCIMLAMYCVMVPLSTIFQERYNIHNVAIAGCIYLSTGVGNIIGSRIAGPQADHIVRKWIAKRGYRRPEDRLRAALLGGGLIMPVSTVIYGWLLQANKGGMAPPIVMLVINGVGSQLTLTAVNTYLVDAAQKRSAESIAVNNFWRYLFAAAASAFVLPMSQRIGLGWTMTVAAAFTWAGFGAIVATLLWGEKWREAAAKRMGEVLLVDEARSRAAEPEPKPEASALPPADVADDAASVFSASSASTAPSPSPSARPGRSRRSLPAIESRRTSHGSDHREEREHGEPSHLPLPTMRRPRPPMARQRSRHGSTTSRASRTSMPSVGDVLQRTISLSGASLHGG